MVNLYGPTEDTTYSTWTVVAKGAEEEPSIGRPIANTEVYILDGAMRPTPIGVYGEIYIGGEGLARCYLNRPEITAEKFAPNPFGSVAGERVYRTGDIGRYGVDGEIEYFGRNDHQVKVRGYRIELGEIERALEEDEMVREAVVMAREDAGRRQAVGGIYSGRERASRGRRGEETEEVLEGEAAGVYDAVGDSGVGEDAAYAEREVGSKRPWQTCSVKSRFNRRVRRAA